KPAKQKALDEARKALQNLEKALDPLKKARDQAQQAFDQRDRELKEARQRLDALVKANLPGRQKHGTGLLLPPLAELQKIIAQQTKKGQEILDQEKKQLGAVAAALPETKLRLKLPRTLPKTFDWCQTIPMPAIKDQGQAGYCWVFASVGALECNWW